MITTQLRNWGNSLGLRMPRSITQTLSITDGTVFEVKTTARGSIELIPRKNSVTTLSELMYKMTPSVRYDDIDYSKAVGRELL